MRVIRGFIGDCDAEDDHREGIVKIYFGEVRGAAEDFPGQKGLP